MKNVLDFNDFLNEGIGITDLFKTKNSKIKEIEQKYIGKNVRFQIKTTNQSGHEIPITFVRSEDNWLERTIDKITKVESSYLNVDIRFKSHTGEHVSVRRGKDGTTHAWFYDGVGEYAYYFNILDLGDLKPIVDEIQSIK